MQRRVAVAVGYAARRAVGLHGGAVANARQALEVIVETREAGRVPLVDTSDPSAPVHRAL
jgi:hypothetical protein